MVEVRRTSLDCLWDYDPRRVVPAFEKLRSVTDKDAADRAYNRLLNALAHNHSGTPSQALPTGGACLVRLVAHLDGWPLACAIDVLTDSYLWVDGARDFRTIDGHTYDLTELQPKIATLDDHLRHVAARADAPATRPATELLKVLAGD